MTSYCVSITGQTTGKCNLFVLYNTIEKYSRIKHVTMNSLFTLKVEIMQISRVHDLYK